MRGVLRERYGESVRPVLIQGGRRLFGRKPSGVSTFAEMDLSAIGGGFAERLISAAEERALWARFGL